MMTVLSASSGTALGARPSLERNRGSPAITAQKKAKRD
jgi:hypothetical protein